jgi:hypothetical protein
MNKNTGSPMPDPRILAAMKAVNPPLEKLMEDRLKLRNDNRQTKAQLDDALSLVSALQHFRDVQLPRYIGLAKLTSLSAATVLLAALAVAYFTHFLAITTTESLFASLLLPLWLVDHAERKFGRWELRIGKVPVFISIVPHV